MLEARGLCKAYGPRVAVENLSLQIRAGEIVGLLGPNGAGKSTTVGMLCGLMAPDRGEVLVGGGEGPQALTPNRPALKRRIGVTPQDLALYDDLSARANLELFGALYGLSGRQLKDRVTSALSLVGLGDRAKDKPSAFSGGMKRRLNIACALVHDPEVLLLDEPTVGVDPQSRNAIFENLKTLRDQGKALIYATHYMEEAERLCDRIVIMDHGCIIAADTLPGLLSLLPMAHTLTLTVDATVDVVLLAQVPGVGRASQRRESLSIGVADLALAVPAVLGWLSAQGHAVTHLDTARANLEDVFLRLTGRQLRDN